MLISNPWKKLQKIHAKKVISEKVTENLSFMDSNSALNFAFYDTQTEFLQKLLFAYISTFC
jgi:hypothetical protein